MKEYEAVWEIFNKCSGNQMRDVFIEEIACDDLEQFVRDKFKDKVLEYDKTERGDGTVIFDIVTSGIRQRYSFTPI